MDVEVFTVGDRARLAEALAVRFAVFVDEQRVPADEEVDEHDRTDPDARHALVRDAPASPAIAAGRSYRKDAHTVHALAFYREAGFTPVGPTFLECEIVHQAMDREL
jgi:predicted GNAT family N-acyltransferase